MPSRIIDTVQTDVACPGRDCTRQLVKLTKQVEGTPRIFEEWVCPTGAQHVTQQWNPPQYYGTA